MLAWRSGETIYILLASPIACGSELREESPHLPLHLRLALKDALCRHWMHSATPTWGNVSFATAHEAKPMLAFLPDGPSCPTQIDHQLDLLGVRSTADSTGQGRAQGSWVSLGNYGEPPGAEGPGSREAIDIQDNGVGQATK